MNVYCYPVDRNSTYVPLLFEGIEDTYKRIYRQDGSLLDALAEHDAGRPVIVHIHWEEFVVRESRSDVEAIAAASDFISAITSLYERGAPIVWTVHNGVPHEIGFYDQFFAMRRALARYADVILVHNNASRAVLAAQVSLPSDRVRVLAHPSYLGRFEDERTLEAGLFEQPERRIQAFGWIRLQKGFGHMIEMLPTEFLHVRDAYVRISGRGVETAAVIAQQPERLDIHWDIRHVPDAEIPRLLRSAACVVLPYERVLTSGVALLAMSVGAMIVAVDVPQLREVLPAESRRFLYGRADGDALCKCIDDVLALSADERYAILKANVSAARAVHPKLTARLLAEVYTYACAAAAMRSGRAR